MSDSVGEITMEAFGAPGIHWQDSPEEAGDAVGDQEEAGDTDFDATSLPTPMIILKKRKRSKRGARPRGQASIRDDGEPDLNSSRWVTNDHDQLFKRPWWIEMSSMDVIMLAQLIEVGN